MSEPSPEAKQAAEKAGYYKLTAPKQYRGYCEGCDTAAAKAREELDELQDLKEFWEKRAELAERTLAQHLAHQQPSAPTADVESLLDNGTCAILSMPKDRQTYEHYRAEVERLFAQARAPLVETLEFYATESLYPDDPNCHPTLTADRGQRARAALQNGK